MEALLKRKHHMKMLIKDNVNNKFAVVTNSNKLNCQ